MFNLDILEIAIGLIFVYLLFSMLVTLLNEYVNAFMKLRGKTLWEAILGMLGSDMAKKFYQHHLVKSLTQEGRQPSYIRPGVFAKVVMDLLAEMGTAKPGAEPTAEERIRAALERIQTDNPVIQLLRSFALEVDYDANKLAVKLEEWFDNVMERATGWYKRKMHIVTLIVSLIVAIVANVDSIRIYEVLSENADLREEVVGMASDFLEQYPELPVPASDSLVANASTSGMPAADSAAFVKARQELLSFYAEEIQPATNAFGLGWKGDQRQYFADNWFLNILGWIITALAISLGAPFWFDLLNRIMQLRSAFQNKPKIDENQNQMPPGMPPSTLSYVAPGGEKPADAPIG